ncbi:MAG: 50S ribosomal protein L4 [Bacteroidia bacterium]|nr:50S ribosomal protein L4 [Bacteroidia bacterium]
MELSVFNKEGKDTGRKVVLADSVFAVEPNDHAIYLDVKQFLADNRQGTHKSKERGEVAGSTRKIKKQKGTGGARAGALKSPVFVGGGRIFGPRPRNYSFKLNKKLKQLARISALSYKAKAQQIIVVEDFTFADYKTKNFVAFQKAINTTGNRQLLVLPDYDNNIYTASRNIPNSEVTIAANLNTYEIMKAKNLVFFESAVAQLNQKTEE